MTLVIRDAIETDFPGILAIFNAVIAPGDSYVFAADTSPERAHAYWFGPGIRSYVASDDDRILGMYKLIANQADRGAHVANASFMVDPAAAGRGIGRAMGEHCLRQAKRAGFRAMQYNFVVSTNVAAVKLWTSLGFETVGRLPGAFQHAELGFVDALVMFRSLDDISAGE